MENLRFQKIETRFSLVSVQQVNDFRFDLAHQQGHALLSEFKKEYNPNLGLALAICPSDPRKDKPFYLEPGFYLTDGIEKVSIDIQGKDTLKVRTIGGGEWAVYTLKGSYQGLAQAWPTAFTLVDQSGKEPDYSELRVPFEVYLNKDCSEEDLRTEIWIPIKNTL